MAKAVDPQRLVVVVQAISTHWEKSARSGADAALRNRVPDALKLPNFDASDAPLSYVLHSVRYAGRNNFAEPIKNIVTVSESAPTELKGIFTSFVEDTLGVSYQYNTGQGAPERYGRKIEALNLSSGQWGRIEYNGRHSWGEYWWYEKWVYNIGLFSHPSTSTFTRSEPTKTFSQMAHLF